MITIYHAKEENFATLGMGALNPIEVTVTWEEGGRYDLTLKQPITDDGKWMMIGDECIIRAPSPVRESPYVEQTAGESETQTVAREIYNVNTPNGDRLRLRQAASMSSKILSSHKPGTEVIRTETSGDWSKVIVIDGGAVGWMYSDYLTYVRTEIESTSKEDKPGAIIKRKQAGDQLYRIADYETDSANGVIVVNAEHISYDLGWVKVIGKCEIKDAPVADALKKVQSMASREHDFEIHCMVSGSVTGDYTNKSLLECIRDPKIGFASQLGARVVCDNFDIWILPDEVRDLGVVLRHRKNLLGVKMKVDTSNRVSRIYPVGEDEDGEPLYLEGNGYVESKNADNLIGKDAVVEYNVKVGDGEGEFATAKEARAELERLGREDMAAGADGRLVSLDVNFLDLGETEEYVQYKGLMVVHPYDTVTVIRGEFGIREKARLNKCVLNGLTKKYNSTTFGAVQSENATVYGFNIASGAVGSAQIAHGSVGASALRNWSVGYAKITQAAVKQLTADSITALRAHINELVAGSVTTDQLYADLATIAAAQITAANINKANINWAEIVTLTAQVAEIAKAQINTASIKEANIGWAEIEELNAQIASIAQAKVNDIEINSADIKDLETTVAKIFSANIGSADIGFAQIKDMVTQQAIITEGVGGQLYIARLAVTEANMVSLSVGELMIKGDDGRFYALGVDEDGNVTTTVKLVVNDDVADNTIHGTDKLIEGSITAQVLNVQNIFGDSAIIRQMIADNLDVARLFAREATIAALNAVDIRGNEYLQLSVNSKSAVYRSEVPPTEAGVSDLWIRPSTGFTYQLASDSEELPEFYIDDDGVLYYAYCEDQTEYALMIDEDGYLYIDSAAPFAVAINEDGTLCWWQRVKDSELDAAARDALEKAEAAQAAANQNAIDMADAVTRLNNDISDLQNQIDGNITSWFISGEPTASNYPASEWTTDELKNIHLGDLCYDENTGYCYRWQITGGAYGWTRIADTDVTKALADAAKAQDTADNKRRVFVAQPVPPYDEGDIWTQGSGGDILRCATPKASGQSFAASDWVLASKYTDDTAANAAMDKANANTVTIEEHSSQIKLLDDQIKLRVTTTVYEKTTSDLRGEIGNAQTAADNAGSAASAAQSSADNAQSTANSASTAAGKAQSTANEAKTAAGNAQAAADANAKLIATQESEIKQLSDQISLRVTETKFSETTSSLRSEISSASNAAGAAQSTADSAASAAGNAQITADNAQTAADAAQNTANGAASAAANAQTSANDAQATADDALEKATSNTTIISRHETEIKQLSDQIDLRVTTAVYEQTTSDLRGEISGASTAASDAQATADTAKSAAAAAQSSANAANTAAGNAQSAADKAQNSADDAQAAAKAAQQTANQNAADMAGIVTQFNADISDLQNQIDGNITSWFISGEPTASNYPASEWTTDELKNIHLGDLCYDENTGYCYRWQITGGAYGWTRIADTDVTKAMNQAAKAQDTADDKRRVFVAQPTPPYDIGDIWVQGSGGDILRCQVPKTSAQSYAASDWVLASKYTDDTAANAASNAASNAQSTANAASNAASNAQSAADNAQTAADNAQSTANAAQNAADANAKLLVEQQAKITLLDNQISSKVSRTELEEVQAEAAAKSVIHYGDNPPAEAGPNDIFVQNGTGIKYKPYAGDGLLPAFYLDDDGYLYYSYDAGQTVYDLMVDDDGRLCIDGDPSFAILIGEDGIPVVWEKITDSELEAAISSAKTELDNLSAETDERINTAYSEMTQLLDEFEFVIAEKVGREEQRVYMRFDANGVLELGKQGDRYVTQTSSSGFMVLQDGAPMTIVERNTVSAPVIEARRQFTLGEFAIRLGANGELLIM